MRSCRGYSLLKQLGRALPYCSVALWLRRGTLEPIITRELGRGALHADWMEDGRARLRAYPIGVVGHWPAGNIEIQPILSMTCALLGGNASLVRIPSDLVDQTRRLMQKLDQGDTAQVLTGRIFMAGFDHARQDFQEAMARAVDGAMIWGGGGGGFKGTGAAVPPLGKTGRFRAENICGCHRRQDLE